MSILIIIFLFFSFSSYASQPEGLVLKPPAVPMGRRILRNKNITFVDNENLTKKVKELKNDEGIMLKTNYKVKGRSRPSRTGSVVSVIGSGETVELIRESEDRRWKAVYVKKNDIKVWVPSSALSKKINTSDHSSSEDSEGGWSEDDSSNE
jgi:hypothetical protein